MEDSEEDGLPYDDDEPLAPPLPASYGSDGYLVLEDEELEEEAAARWEDEERAAEIESAMDQAVREGETRRGDLSPSA